jgi:hexokinase
LRLKVDIIRSVAEFLPFFEERMRAALRLILGDAGEKRIQMGMARDGSGVGGTCPYMPQIPERSSYASSLLAAALCALQAKKAEMANVHPESEKMDALVP